MVNSVIITADGNIVQKSTGNPSGSVNTISDNTLALYWLLAYAWYLLASEGDFLNVTPNHTLVDIVGYDGVRDV